MKTVGILTFHYVDNYGAVLQTWALREILREKMNCKAEVINYVPRNYRIEPYGHTRRDVRLMEKKRTAFERFLREKCDIRKPMVDCVCGNEFDYYCVGSDQVWNMSFSENRDKEYLFPHLDNKAKRFSYAASMGTRLKEEYACYFEDYLKCFQMISVREPESVDDIEAFTRSRIQVVLDPTLLVDAKRYEELIEEPRYKESGFLFLFSYYGESDARRMAPFVNMLAHKFGLRIKHSFTKVPRLFFTNNAGTMKYEGVGEFLWYMKNASIVVTTSYHGLIFAHIFKKPIFIFLPERGKMRFNYITEILGVKKQIINDDWMFKKWEPVKDCKTETIEIDSKRAQSIDFIKEALGT